MTKRGERFALPINIALPQCSRFCFPQAGQPEKLLEVRAFVGIVSVEFLRPDVFNDRLEFFKARSRTDWFRWFYSPQMSGRRSRDDSIADRHLENFFDARHVQIAGVR